MTRDSDILKDNRSLFAPVQLTIGNAPLSKARSFFMEKGKIGYAKEN